MDSYLQALNCISFKQQAKIMLQHCYVEVRLKKVNHHHHFSKVIFCPSLKLEWQEGN